MDEYVQYNTMCTVEYVHCTVQYSITNYTVSAQYMANKLTEEYKYNKITEQ